MQLTKKVRLYPNKTMAKILNDLCNYRRYRWNHGLELWNDLYDQRIEMIPASLLKKSQLVIKDKTIKFSKDEQELLDLFPSPSERAVRDLMVKDKEDWQYQLSSKVLQLAVRDLAQAWSTFFDSQKSKTKTKTKNKSKKLKVGKPSFRTKKNPKLMERASKMANLSWINLGLTKVIGMAFSSKAMNYQTAKLSIVQSLKSIINIMLH